MGELFLIILTALTDDDLYRRTRESEGLAQAVFDISLIGEMEELGVVTEDNEGGGRNAYLSHIVDLETLALVRGGLDAHLRLAKHLVEHTR